MIVQICDHGSSSGLLLSALQITYQEKLMHDMAETLFSNSNEHKSNISMCLGEPNAFDTVDQYVFLSKLSTYGVTLVTIMI